MIFNFPTVPARKIEVGFNIVGLRIKGERPISVTLDWDDFCALMQNHPITLFQYLDKIGTVLTKPQL